MRAYLKSRARVIAAFLLFEGIFAAVLLLSGVPLGAFGYASALCGAAAAGYGVYDIVKFCRKRRILEQLREEIELTCDNLPKPEDAAEEAYAELIRQLHRSRAELEARYNESLSDMADYYTMWAHQIKTPIAAMRLILAEQDTPESRELTEGLTRIEQYVEMVLCYIRLESVSTDYVIRECDLDSIIRAALRRFSSQFIRKKLKLGFEPTGAKVLTDEKWLLFVIEQVLSNSLKYTVSGVITITFENGILEIRDTGIGISPEDLPRIFDKGYTGCNGRTDMKASGIGLYLCRRICRALGHSITASSSETGTAIRIGLERSKVDFRD
ncbi:MAG: sensor histidine kinase [Oscillospiraceae bacterium]|nr:sensor histidine kinase [Oscillospiraceae bacterium]